MSRCSGNALALMLSLCLVPAVAGAAPSGSVDATVVASEVDPTLEEALQAAAAQLGQGDTLGAAIAYERLLADPRLDTLSPERLGEVWTDAAVSAGMQNDEALAEQRIRKALTFNPRLAHARLLLAAHQLRHDQLDAAADNMIQGIADSPDMPGVDADTVWYLSSHLRDAPAKRLALLQGLFDHGWKADGMEPTWQWADLATLQVDAGQRDKVAATLERVDEPLQLIQLRSDKRFDPFLRRDDPRFDPVAAAQRHIDRLRVDTLLTPGLNEKTVALANTLVMAGQPEEVVAYTNALNEVAEKAASAPGAQQARLVTNMLGVRARAQWQLGRTDDAIQTQALAVRMAATDDPAEAQLRLAAGYISLHRPALARQSIKGLEELTANGQGIVHLIELNAALQLNDEAAAQRARDGLAALRKQMPSYLMQGFITENRLDDAAVLLTERLADPTERGLALLELQDLRVWPEQPADKAFYANWAKFKARRDVNSATRKVGRIERYPLFAE